MKLIIAIVRPERLSAVEATLERQEACLLSVSQVLGDGRDPGYTEIYRGREVHRERPKVRLEIAVDDLFAEAAVAAIVRAASTGEPGRAGDGKVLVLQMDECAHIRNGGRESLTIDN
jgi:nitrogen regulatory protein P-II 2